MELSDAERATIVRRMERSCLNETVISCTNDGIDCYWTVQSFRERYSARCYQILIHLDGVGTAEDEMMPPVMAPTKTPYLLTSILAKDIDPNEVAKLSFIELCPEATAKERAEIDTRRGIKVEIKVSRAYTCRCGRNETTINEYVARSADEALKISIQCVHCGNRWNK